MNKLFAVLFALGAAIGVAFQARAADLTLEQATAAIEALPKLAKPLDLWPLSPAFQKNAPLVKALTSRIGAVCIFPRDVALGTVDIPPAGTPWSVMDQPQQLAASSPVTQAVIDQVTRDELSQLLIVARKAKSAGNPPARIWIDDEWVQPAGWTAAAWQAAQIKRQALLDGLYEQLWPDSPRIWYGSGQVNGQHVPVPIGTHDGIIVYYPDVPSICDAIMVANPGTPQLGTAATKPAALWLSLRWSNNTGTFATAATPEQRFALGARWAGQFDAGSAAQAAWNRADCGLLYDHRDPTVDPVTHPQLWRFDPTDPRAMDALKAFANGARAASAG